MLKGLVVRTPAITAQNALDVLTQQRRQPSRATPGMNHEHGHAHRRSGPQPTQLTRLFPTGLVGMLDVRNAHRLQSFLVRRGQSGTDFLLQVGDGRSSKLRLRSCSVKG